MGTSQKCRGEVSMATVTPEEVLTYDGPTDSYLCPLSANIYNVEFLAFKIRDIDSNTVLFEVKKDTDSIPPDYVPADDDDSARCIRYDFGSAFLNLKTIGTTYAPMPSSALPCPSLLAPNPANPRA